MDGMAPGGGSGAEGTGGRPVVTRGEVVSPEAPPEVEGEARLATVEDGAAVLVRARPDEPGMKAGPEVRLGRRVAGFCLRFEGVGVEDDSRGVYGGAGSLGMAVLW